MFNGTPNFNTLVNNMSLQQISCFIEILITQFLYKLNNSLPTLTGYAFISENLINIPNLGHGFLLRAMY